MSVNRTSGINHSMQRGGPNDCFVFASWNSYCLYENKRCSRWTGVIVLFLFRFHKQWQYQWHTVTPFSSMPDFFSTLTLKLMCLIPYSIPPTTSYPHYGDVTMGAITSQITSLMIVYSTVYSGADQSKHQSSASLTFVWEIHRGPVNFPHKWPVMRKMFPFDDVIMINIKLHCVVYVWYTVTCIFVKFM